MTHLERRQRRAEIAAAISEGVSIAAVCRRFRVELDTVLRACREAGINTNRRIQAATSLQIVAELQNTNDSHKIVARKCKVTRQRVEQIFKAARAAGIRFPGRE